MIQYHINHPNGTATLADGATLSDAKHLARSIGRGAKILYSVDTAAELNRQTDRGPFWASRLVMAGSLFDHGPAMSKARRRWAKVLAKAEGGTP